MYEITQGLEKVWGRERHGRRRIVKIDLSTLSVERCKLSIWRVSQKFKSELGAGRRSSTYSRLNALEKLGKSIEEVVQWGGDANIDSLCQACPGGTE